MNSTGERRSLFNGSTGEKKEIEGNFAAQKLQHIVKRVKSPESHLLSLLVSCLFSLRYYSQQLYNSK